MVTKHSKGSWSMQCSITDSVEASSVASSAGRSMRRTPNPKSCTVRRMASQSVDTYTASIKGQATAARSTQAHKGCPPSGRMFFIGMLLEPPRRGIKAIQLWVVMRFHCHCFSGTRVVAINVSVLSRRDSMASYSLCRPAEFRSAQASCPPGFCRTSQCRWLDSG